jgi:hypothetical protein
VAKEFDSPDPGDTTGERAVGEDTLDPDDELRSALAALLERIEPTESEDDADGLDEEEGPLPIETGHASIDERLSEQSRPLGRRRGGRLRYTRGRAFRGG